MSHIPPPFVKMEPTTPDFDDILDQFYGLLATQASWNSMLTSGTGSALLRFISSIGAFSQESIERAQQETINDTARLPTSLIRIARMQGVHIQRRRPSNVAVSVRAPRLLDTPLVIPAYTQWSGGNIGLGLYNRDRIVVGPGIEPVGVQLFTGVIYNEKFTGSGQGYDQFQFGSRDFGVSDDDLWAEVNGERWENTHKGLWRFSPEAQIFFSNTLPNGMVRALFGNNVYGKMLKANDIVTFRYVYVDDMTRIPNVPVGSKVLCRPFPGLLAKTLTTPTGYEPHRPPSWYKVLTPAISAAKERAVTRDDHRALVMEYPGVVDNTWLGQAELNPGDLRWMNVAGVCLLTTRPWAAFEWDNFRKWYITEVGMSALEIYRIPEEPITINIRMEIGIFNRANAESVFSLARTEIESFFTPRVGSLGSSTYMSDLIDVLKENISDTYGPLIDYIHINRPEEYVKLRKTQYPVLGSLGLDVKYTTRDDLRLLSRIT